MFCQSDVVQLFIPLFDVYFRPLRFTWYMRSSPLLAPLLLYIIIWQKVNEIIFAYCIGFCVPTYNLYTRVHSKIVNEYNTYNIGTYTYSVIIRGNAIVPFGPLSRGDWRSRWSKGILAIIVPIYTPKTITGIIDRIFRSDSLSVWQGCNESRVECYITARFHNIYNIIVVCVYDNHIFFRRKNILYIRGETRYNQIMIIDTGDPCAHFWMLQSRRDVYRAAIFVVFTGPNVFMLYTHTIMCIKKK